MADYIATAICEGDHWVIDVEGIGTTQVTASTTSMRWPWTS